MTESHPASTPLPSGSLLVVRWRHPDGSITSGCPLPPPHAEAVARAFARIYPRQAYWLEPVPWLLTATPRRARGARTD